MQDDTYIVSVKPVDKRNRARDTVLTLVMWGIYIYLWIPLITLAAWLLGFERFYEVMISYGGFTVVIGLMDVYGLTIIGIAICVVSWSGINYYRFHSKERRYAVPATDPKKIGEFFGLPEAEAARVRTSRRLLIDLDQAGGIVEISHNATSPGTDQVYRADSGAAATSQSLPEAPVD